MPFLSLLGLSLIWFCFDLVWNFCLISDPFLTSIVFLYCFRDIRVGLALWSVVDVDGGIVGGNLRLVHILVRVRITCPANHNTNNSSNLFNKGFWQKTNNKWLFCQVIVLFILLFWQKEQTDSLNLVLIVLIVLIVLNVLIVLIVLIVLELAHRTPRKIWRRQNHQKLRKSYAKIWKMFRPRVS